MILITGTGRSGTLTWTHYLRAHGLAARHEPNTERLLELAPPALRGADPIVGLSWLRWPEASAHHLYACVWDALERLFTPQWVWVRRDPYETVASMLGCDWYGGHSNRWSGRPTAVDAGEMTDQEWQELPQIGRCAWWTGWAIRQLERLPAERTLRVELLGDHLQPLRQLGFATPIARLPLNVSQHPPLSGEQRRMVSRFV